MENSQFLELLQTLGDQEKERFLLFAGNFYFNNGRDKAFVRPLIQICYEYFDGNFPQISDKKAVFTRLFSDHAFVEGKLEKVMVEAHKVLRSFLLTEQYFSTENEFQQNLDLAEIVRKRGLVDRYLKITAGLQATHEATSDKNYIYFYRKIALETSIHAHLSINNHKKGDVNLPKLLATIEHFYHLRRIELLNRYLIQKKITILEDTDAIVLNLSNTTIPTYYLEESPTLQIYYTIFKLLLLEKLTINKVNELSQLISLHKKTLGWEDIQAQYTYLRNFCTLLLMDDPNNMEAVNLLFNSYKDNLQDGYLHYEQKLSPIRYRAVYEIALRLQEYDWAYQFIERYKDEIHRENESKDIYRFANAAFLFAIGEFDKCLDFIPDTSPFSDFLLIGKRLELKALYELKSDLLSYKIDAFKMFLSRTSKKILSETMQKKNSDFINLLHQLLKSTPGDVKRAEQVLSRIENKKQSMEWQWLKEKAEALKKRL